jgi:hypothetical protein
VGNWLSSAGKQVLPALVVTGQAQTIWVSNMPPACFSNMALKRGTFARKEGCSTSLANKGINPT